MPQLGETVADDGHEMVQESGRRVVRANHSSKCDRQVDTEIRHDQRRAYRILVDEGVTVDVGRLASS